MAAKIWKYVLVFVIVNSVAAERIKDMIYMPLEGVAACFRRHNGTHQFGCSSSRSGNVGVVHLIETDKDVTWIERNATAGPYIVVLPLKKFTKEILFRFRNTNNVNGVLLTRNISHEPISHYSPDDKCPNRYSGYEKCNDHKPWNPFGSALFMEDWPFPMFYTENQTVLEAVRSCFQEHNAHDLDTQYQRPLCAIEMKSFMFAAINSESCLRRSDTLSINPTQYCDPLGDRNIHWPLAPLNKNKNTVIMVTARLDASSLFEDISPGAGNVITGLVTFLATAYYLNLLNATVDKTNVVFSLLNGEAFDYIGSSYMVYELKQNNFNALGGVNLKLDDIKSIIEFGQLSKGEIFLHSRGKDDMINRLQKALNATELLEDSVPPTSVQSFLKEKPSLTTIVISNHGQQFVNPYYNSILDDAKSLNYNRNDTTLPSHLANIAIQVANELYQAVTGERAPQTAAVNLSTSVEDLVAEMLYCYLETAKCPLFHAASMPGTKLINQVLPLYIGVYRVPSFATMLTGQLLAFLTGEKLFEMDETTCHANRLLWLTGKNSTGLCINSTVNNSMAVSPAFMIDGYNMKSGLYSTWTESVWNTLRVRMFLKPSAKTERFSIILGSLVATSSFALVWFINNRADILFYSRRTVDC